jgi:hypothetical protein
MAARPAPAHHAAMPQVDLGELALTTTLFSIYLGARGTARALGAVQAAVGGLERARGRPGPGTGRLGPVSCPNGA